MHTEHEKKFNTTNVAHSGEISSHFPTNKDVMRGLPSYPLRNLHESLIFWFILAVVVLRSHFGFKLVYSDLHYFKHFGLLRSWFLSF